MVHEWHVADMCLDGLIYTCFQQSNVHTIPKTTDKIQDTNHERNDNKTDCDDVNRSKKKRREEK